MAVRTNSKTSRRSAIALALAALTLPGIAAAEPGGEDRGGWRGRDTREAGESREAQGNIGASGWSRPAPQPQPQRSWAGNGGGGGGWSRPQATPAPAPQAAPAPNPNWSGDRGQRGGWSGGNNSGGGWSGGQRGDGAQPAPAPVPQQRWNGNNGGQSQGRERDRDHDRDHDRDGDRRGNWSGNQGWSSGNNWSRDRDRDHDGDRWRGNNWNRGNMSNGSRDGYNNDYRRWDNRWRNNNRYDWYSYRRSHSDVYRLGSYYAPYRGYSYRRLSIGFFLDRLFFGQDYWIDNPWQYRLPDVYGPYRWVRYYDDALLVNIYTGEVVDVINDFFW